jgi:hypothetical protein
MPSDLLGNRLAFLRLRREGLKVSILFEEAPPDGGDDEL